MKILLLLLLIALGFGNLLADYNHPFYKALRFVESSDGVKLVGDHGKAIGVYQLHKIYVDDVNRIYKTSFTYDDRWDPIKSHQIVRLYLFFYRKEYIRRYKKDVTVEILARIHNGGPEGYLKESTKKYGCRVKNYILKQTRR